MFTKGKFLSDLSWYSQRSENSVLYLQLSDCCTFPQFLCFMFHCVFVTLRPDHLYMNCTVSTASQVKRQQTHTYTHKHTHIHTNTQVLMDWRGKCVCCRFLHKISVIIQQYSAQQPAHNTHTMRVSLHMRDCFRCISQKLLFWLITSVIQHSECYSLLLSSLITHIYLKIKLFKKTTGC